MSVLSGVPDDGDPAPRRLLHSLFPYRGRLLAAADVLAWLLAILGTVALRLGLDVDKIS
ncbi:MAG: hypothetical protein GY701_02210, partial [Sulfitobacter sp.]|nr:hypothetical protein [Sulfitobacter sp.]